MASNSASKTVYTSQSKSHGYVFSTSFNETATDTYNNTSTISVSGSITSQGLSWSSSSNSKLAIYWYDDNAYTGGTLIKSTSFSSLNNNGSKSVSGTITVPHKTDGNLNGYCKLVFTKGGTSSYTPASTNLSTGSTPLTTIPRYANSYQGLNSLTETTITMNWSSDSIIDYIWYDINGSNNWIPVGATYAYSGSYVITGLAPNTTYYIRTLVKRSDSQLTTSSASLPITTYANPYVTRPLNFMLGNQLTLSLYNPLYRECNIYIIPDNGTEIFVGSTNNTSISALIDATVIDLLNKASPNSANNNYSVKCVCPATGSTQLSSSKGVYTIPASPPDFEIIAKDINQATLNLTKNEDIVVLLYSTMKITVNATAKNYASIFEYYVNGIKILENNTSIENCNTNVFSVRVVDSRGFETTKTLTKEKIDYVFLTCNPKFYRKSQTSEEVLLSYSGNYYNGSFGEVDNTLKLSWAFREKGKEEWTTGGSLKPTIEGNSYSGSISCGKDFDYQTNYEFIVYFGDKLITNQAVIISLSKGIPNFIIGYDALYLGGDRILSREKLVIPYAELMQKPTASNHGVRLQDVANKIYCVVPDSETLYYENNEVHISEHIKNEYFHVEDQYIVVDKDCKVLVDGQVFLEGLNNIFYIFAFIYQNRGGTDISNINSIISGGMTYQTLHISKGLFDCLAGDRFRVVLNNPSYGGSAFTLRGGHDNSRFTFQVIL